MNVATNFDLRFKSGAYQDEKISEEHFMTASGIVAGHQCRKRKGLYSTSAEASERWPMHLRSPIYRPDLRLICKLIMQV